MDIGTAEIIAIVLLAIGIPTIFLTAALLIKRQSKRNTRRR
ncbi:MAG: hypothetical protein M0026_01170 [Nocardiopsaceae bacterium]|nr:hypothetical protein [Nocardiopsaceae bacterium]